MDRMLCFCVRHGQTIYNADGRIQGQSNAPLSDLGRRQSAAVAQALAGQSIDALYASPLSRARETAQAISDALGLPIRSDSRLMELNAGIFQDRLRSDLAQECPEILASWLRGDPDFAIPGGESRRELLRRGEAAFRDIAAAGHQRVVIVSHGGLLTAVFNALLAFDPPLRPFGLENGSITQVQFTEGRAALIALNQTEHLRGIAHSGQGDLESA
jgi:2,3-bisphosphoglycerate-dependent phosphoglycerate mutase